MARTYARDGQGQFAATGGGGGGSGKKPKGKRPLRTRDQLMADAIAEGQMRQPKRKPRRMGDMGQAAMITSLMFKAQDGLDAIGD